MNNGSGGNMPVSIQNTPTQMLTPIKSLPLKTTAQTEDDIDDPLIQNVLKEFENEIGGAEIRRAPEIQHIEQNSEPVPTQYVTQTPPQQFQHEQNLASLSYEQAKAKSKWFNIDMAKKSAILTIVICILQYTNVLKIISNRLPATAVSYISGREYIINTLLMFCVIYVAFYIELI